MHVITLKTYNICLDHKAIFIQNSLGKIGLARTVSRDIHAAGNPNRLRRIVA